MNRNYHMKYRRSVYRRKRIRLTVIISTVTVVVLLTAFLVVGNLLLNRDTPVADNTDTQNEETTGLQGSSVSAVRALPLALASEDGASLSSRLSAIGTQTSAVSVSLNDGAGNLLFSSSVAKSFSFLNTASGVASISSVCNTVKGRGYYMSAVFTVNAFSERDAVARSVRLSAYSAVAAEALLAGVDDVLLRMPMVDGELSAEELDRLTEELGGMAKSIKELAPDGRVGVALDQRFLGADGASLFVDRLSESFDYLAIDATRFGEAGAVAYAESMVESNLFYFLSRNMRLLLPNAADDGIRSSLLAIAEKYESNRNWQFLP